MTQTYATFVPSQDWIDSLKVGDYAPDCFGTMSQVREIRYRGTDLNGNAYLGVLLAFGPNSTISQSYKVGKPVSTVRGGTSGRYATVEAR